MVQKKRGGGALGSIKLSFLFGSFGWLSHEMKMMIIVWSSSPLHILFYASIFKCSWRKIRLLLLLLLEDVEATWASLALSILRSSSSSSSKISYSCRSSFLKESPGRHKKTMFIKLLHALLALWWFLPYSINEMTLGLKRMVVRRRW